MIAVEELRYGDVIRYRGSRPTGLVYLYLGRYSTDGYRLLAMSPSMTPKVARMFLTDGKAWEKVS